MAESKKDAGVEQAPPTSGRESSEPTQVERDAAWNAFKALARAGLRSTSQELSREELHER